MITRRLMGRRRNANKWTFECKITLINYVYHFSLFYFLYGFVKFHFNIPYIFNDWFQNVDGTDQFRKAALMGFLIHFGFWCYLHHLCFSICIFEHKAIEFLNAGRTDISLFTPSHYARTTENVSARKGGFDYLGSRVTNAALSVVER